MKLVQFNDGTFGIRKRQFFVGPFVYLNLRDYSSYRELKWHTLYEQEYRPLLVCKRDYDTTRSIFLELTTTPVKDIGKVIPTKDVLENLGVPVVS